ncbi:MAG: hypothetical protein QX203_10205 [Methylococcaceae bacterium]|jgi:hypothetical protein
MKIFFLISIMLAFTVANAGVYDSPACYSTVPTTCAFNDMTLEMCNEEGKVKKIVFLASQRIHIAGGNKFASANGKATCIVQHIKDTEPAKYEVKITK